MTDRGLSTTVGYVLNLVVATVLIAGLLTATAGVVEHRQQAAVRTELGVVGQRLAANLMAADRLAVVGGDSGRVSLVTSLPEQVAGVRYTVAVNASRHASYVTLTAQHPDVVVRVRFRNETRVGNATLHGGPVTVVRRHGVLEVHE